MLRAFGLFAICVVWLVITGPQVSRGDVPDCGSCDCSISVAWQRTNDNVLEVLATHDPNFPNNFGTPVSTAKWSSPAPSNVYAPLCVTDNHFALDSTHRKWTFENVSWTASCARLASQMTNGMLAYTYQASPNRTAGDFATRYDCGDS